jgi:hypothetical protein
LVGLSLGPSETGRRRWGAERGRLKGELTEFIDGGPLPLRH